MRPYLSIPIFSSKSELLLITAALQARGLLGAEKITVLLVLVIPLRALKTAPFALQTRMEQRSSMI